MDFREMVIIWNHNVFNLKKMFDQIHCDACEVNHR